MTRDDHGHHSHHGDLEPLDRYRGRLLDAVAPLPAEAVALADALGCIAAAPVHADRDLPPFDNAAMDGFAVRAGEAAAGAVLPIAGEVAAGGRGEDLLPDGAALRISTGAPVPPGADAVLPIEQAVDEGSAVGVQTQPELGAHIRRAGEDLAAGGVALAAGTRLGPVEIGLAAACGVTQVAVHPRPRLAVLPTGDELAPAGAEGPRPRGMITDSNGPALAAAAREAGAEPVRLPAVPDDPDELRAALRAAVAAADVVVLTGGVSVGRHDHVYAALAALGEAAEAKVAVQPGKPQAHGLVEGTPCVGLPGNPVSALVSFEIFIRPVLARLAGRPDRARPRVAAVTGAALPGGGARARVVLCRLAPGEHADAPAVVTPTGPQSSHRLHGAAGAEAYVVVPPGHSELPVGSAVAAWLLSGEGWEDGQAVARGWAGAGAATAPAGGG